MSNPGWYPYESEKHAPILRWWDGQQWTKDTRIVTHPSFSNPNDFAYAPPLQHMGAHPAPPATAPASITQHVEHFISNTEPTSQIPRKRVMKLVGAGVAAIIFLAAAITYGAAANNNFGKPTPEELINIKWAASAAPNILNTEFIYDKDADCDVSSPSCEKYALTVTGIETYSDEDYIQLVSQVGAAHTSNEPLNICLSDNSVGEEFQKPVSFYQKVIQQAGVPDEKIVTGDNKVCVLYSKGGQVH